MKYPRCGFAARIISEMTGEQSCHAHDAIDFLDQNETLDEALVEYVTIVMQNAGCHDEICAQTLCAMFEFFWSGHAGIAHHQMPDIFSRWMAAHEAQADVQKMIAWIERSDNPFIYGDNRIIVYDRDRELYSTPQLLLMQQKLADQLKFWVRPLEIPPEQVTSFQQKLEGIEGLHPNQRAAIEHIWTSRLTVVTGGPGTGKTSKVVTTALQMAEIFGIGNDDVFLTAPTGKAAQRMADCLNNAYEAMTLHRLLNLRPNARSPYRPGNALPAKLVIVDEVSMMALPLAETLFMALNPDDTRLVLIGDPQQLSPVDVGEILSNFMKPDSKKAFYRQLASCRVHLTKNYRVLNIDSVRKDNIYNVQQKVADGAWNALETISSKDASALSFEQFEYCANIEQTGDILKKWCRRICEDYRSAFHAELRSDAQNYPDLESFKQPDIERIERLYKHLDAGYRVLSSVNEGRWGADNLNAFVIREIGLGTGRFPCGSLVMLTQNDYRIGHFNGETGIVVRMRRRETGNWATMVAFPKSSRQNDASESSTPNLSFDFEPIEILSSMIVPAFAMTIHKSQGSEYAHGLIILPPRDSLLLSRNLLYTAISRTREGATLVATRDVFKSCVARTPIEEPGLV